MKKITSEELKQRLEEQGSSLKLINALDPRQFELMHIPRSLNLTQREQIVEELQKDDDIVVYCTNEVCYRSRVLYTILEEMGYRKVRRFSGGLEEWDRMGFPVEGTMATNAA
jgi:rhodanese-related sulfurtransferase